MVELPSIGMRQRAVILTGQDGTKYAYGPFRSPERCAAFAVALREHYGEWHSEVEELTLDEPTLPVD